jgi:hypothetical protein
MMAAAWASVASNAAEGSARPAIEELVNVRRAWKVRYEGQ